MLLINNLKICYQSTKTPKETPKDVGEIWCIGALAA
jgi:hypothetical protein